MKAFVIPQSGTQAIESAEVPVPQLAADELLVHVRAVGVGIHDSYFLPSEPTYPFPIGIEAAGDIEAIGSSVTGYQPGERIAFVSSMQPKGGTWAEFVAVKATSLIIPIPATMDYISAAAVPVAGNTALKAFGVLTTVRAGGSLFIAGGSGAIGTFAIQLARQRGWRVAASASSANHEYMRELGAEKTVDYHDSDWQQKVLEWMPGGVDAALAIQPGTSAQSLPVVKDGGSLVSVSGDSVSSERGILMQGIPYQMDVQDDIAKLMMAVTSSEIRLEVERVYPFDEARDALAKVQTRRARGKIVLRLE
ncbi:NADP-dependent oxidoreductase [Paeniglutamicibacter antarcticus]|uniref:NADP-dependent oxidoreductase n=1 Tax=Paeniglutamicibacter antarcticus TaxID=494023 RepID=A0ABP9THQ6_9MICC